MDMLMDPEKTSWATAWKMWAAEYRENLSKNSEPLTADDEVVVLGTLSVALHFTNALLISLSPKSTCFPIVAFSGANLPMAIGALMAIDDGLSGEALVSSVLNEGQNGVNQIVLASWRWDEGKTLHYCKYKRSCLLRKKYVRRKHDFICPCWWPHDSMVRQSPAGPLRFLVTESLQWCSCIKIPFSRPLTSQQHYQEGFVWTFDHFKESACSWQSDSRYFLLLLNPVDIGNSCWLFGFKPGINTHTSVLVMTSTWCGKVGNNPALLKKRDRYLRI